MNKEEEDYKRYLEALLAKYNDLVWYARSSEKHEHIKGVKAEKMRIENEHTEECINLVDIDEDNWQHGFNSGMLAALRLFSERDKQQAMKELPHLHT